MLLHHSLFDSLLTLLFPDRCAGCQRPGTLFCASCCAALVPYSDIQLVSLKGMTHVHIAFVYQSPLREAIHRLKYDRLRRMAGPLGALLATYVAAHPLVADAILPVPLHTSRLAERGFNQAEELAQALTHTGLPLINDKLIRIRMTEQQVRLTSHERRSNVDRAFAWHGTTAPPRRVLLIDDVMTTGSTMSACAAALRAAGVEEIAGLVLARSYQ